MQHRVKKRVKKSDSQVSRRHLARPATILHLVFLSATTKLTHEIVWASDEIINFQENIFLQEDELNESI